MFTSREANFYSLTKAGGILPRLKTINLFLLLAPRSKYCKKNSNLFICCVDFGSYFRRQYSLDDNFLYGYCTKSLTVLYLGSKYRVYFPWNATSCTSTLYFMIATHANINLRSDQNLSLFKRSLLIIFCSGSCYFILKTQELSNTAESDAIIFSTLFIRVFS